MSGVLMAAQMGLSVVQGLSQHRQQKQQFQMDQFTQIYNNVMSNFSKAMELNTQTDNEIMARDALVRDGAAVQLQSLRDKAEAETGAAAAGVTGGSVAMTMRGLQRSNLQAKHALWKRKQAEVRASTQNRRNTHLAAAMSADVSLPKPPPSKASALLGIGASMVDIYDSHQPDGSKIADKLGSWLGG